MKNAEETAIAILTWLADEPELMSRFLALTGTDPTSLRSAIGEPGFMGGIVAFLMEHEPTLMAFCNKTHTSPEEVVRAHHALSGARDFEED
ncbi:DUF3572 family protein [Sinorhizobium medicae]|uniref:DUF3572 family protein n=2 Tax=Sinorhizobium medicae TaxID=110321 RepID=A0A508WNM3_9HYPH|nr:DUF3572 domain-containing protein [Sinorhizobium medicae]ABR59779.1 conserved hypothetical protein [Sinorhizobium medicae WSM419]MBO1939826.1 DUF3572 domain-containing protein [Sinorhizobium medicae]MBO1962866.1 DUF3572 domain-containing protein [Sinorhizobium medicae]MDX0407340.1 DUF3572 family protein [Sinorhizobium medicae]MDX0413608.1 DUF3572 family protein [Sinorhizobium medicae]